MVMMSFHLPFSNTAGSLVSIRELRRGESDEEMHSCLPTLAESDFVETKAGSKSKFTSYKKPKYSEKRSVLDV
jgi:hypothetical protein